MKNRISTPAALLVAALATACPTPDDSGPSNGTPQLVDRDTGEDLGNIDLGRSDMLRDPFLDIMDAISDTNADIADVATVDTSDSGSDASDASDGADGTDASDGSSPDTATDISGEPEIDTQDADHTPCSVPGAPDSDGDGVCDVDDNCPGEANPDQSIVPNGSVDCDGDSFVDDCDATCESGIPGCVVGDPEDILCLDDCDDTTVLANPGRGSESSGGPGSERCINGLDDDCNGRRDSEDLSCQ